ncbi:MAG: enoyl-CoA hydratase/isomerase family protein [Deltaproteobacteria bacterium]|nr:MAG: enoyl-CoA hydratase/isomerase family protein [Deltaproteobacteria bacterium]
MAVLKPGKDIAIERDGHVATVEIRRGPHNYFDFELIAEIADAFEALDEDPTCRAIVLAAEGKSFCAGARLGGGGAADAEPEGPAAEDPFRRDAARLYTEAVRLFRARTPVVGAIHGAAVGGGLGLALVADVRVTCPEARFSANFSRLGFHPGFGLSVTLPALIGPSKAALLFFTGRRVTGSEAVAMGLADRLVERAAVRPAAVELAAEIAASAPLAVAAMRATVRDGLAERIEAAVSRELDEQAWLIRTADAREGIAAMAERRTPRFEGR